MYLLSKEYFLFAFCSLYCRMQLHLIDALVKGVFLGLFMAISVGPTLFAVIRYSLNHSYRAGLAFVLGVSISDILYVTMANLAAGWLEVMKGYEKPIALGGAVILMVVGGTGLFRKYKPTRPLCYTNRSYARALFPYMAQWISDQYYKPRRDHNLVGSSYRHSQYFWLL